ncbi:MAG: efflux RND transporter periplasmic adaptor subunit [Nitrospinae bacterium]|nr:efflux RND transporter periplasmic adaptor subunit [Nitrospinota bacterium]
MKSLWMNTFFAAITGLSLAAPLAHGQAQPAPQKAPQPAQAPAPAPQPLILSTGVVASKASITLSSKISAQVVRISGDLGSPVKKGQVIMKLDDGELGANVALARGHLDSAKAAYENATLGFDRQKRLLSQGSTTQSAYDEANTAMQRAQAGVAVAEAELRKAQVYLAYTNIVSPINGVIESKSVEVGELTSPGQPVVKVADTKNLRFETSVKESDINLIGVGDKVEVTVDALPNKTISGTVAQIVPAGDRASHSFLVRIDLPLTEGLRAGMYGKARWR